ncbi:putative groupII intron reverse transcriptase /maturase (mitochondrion) [Bryopsis sp. KO-2023]|nr:putative groupII intron reverse transcriptase /maturase [Bryopsis sp. KO-2023]
MLVDYYKKERKATATLSMKLKSKVHFNNIDLSVFSDLRAQAGGRLKCLLWRIMAIEELSKMPGSATPGIDGVCFKPVPAATHSTNKALKALKDRSEFLKDKLSLAKGKTDQAIKRKGLQGLQPRELERRHLKSMRDVRTEYRKELNYLLNNPVRVLQEIIEESNTNNLAIKLNWVKETKNRINVNNLIKFASDPIKRVYIPKPNSPVGGKLRPLGIPTIRDRGIQMLLKLVLEPIMEPLGDKASFGFRPGRNGHQAVSYLANRLMLRRRPDGCAQLPVAPRGLNSKKMQRAPPALRDTGSRACARQKRADRANPSLLDCDIKGWFDNISHNWWIANVPFPKGFEALFVAILKAPIIGIDPEKEEIGNKRADEKTGGIIFDSGVPQGGIISPILINWALDGIENLVSETVKQTYSSPLQGRELARAEGKVDFLKRVGNENLSKFTGRRTVGASNKGWMVRYADHFIVGVNNPATLPVIVSTLIDFLGARAPKARVSAGHIKRIQWSVGKKFDFLSWTFHLIKPVRVNWMIRAPRKAVGRLRLIDWLGLYVYPSRAATKSLRSRIKVITNSRQRNTSLGTLISKLTLLLRGWSEYFSPGGKQVALRRALDYYIYKRCKKFLFHKYRGASRYKIYSSFLKDKTEKWTQLHIKNRYDDIIQQIPCLWRSAVDHPWRCLAPNRKLLNHSALVNVHGYIERIIHIGKLKDKTHEAGGAPLAVKYGEQKGLCNFCKKPLIDWEEKIPENSPVDDNYIALRKIDMLFDKHEWLGNSGIMWYTCIGAARNLRSAQIDKSPRPVQLPAPRNPTGTIGAARFWGQASAPPRPEGLYIDHVVPKGLGVLYDLKKTLEHRSNKQLLHRNCHRTKYALDKKFVSKFKENYSNALERIKATHPGVNCQNPTNLELDTAKIKALTEIIGMTDNQAIIRQRSEHTWNKIQRLLKKKKAELNIDIVE